MRLSPNQTDSKTPDCSARTAASRIVSIFVRPKSTPRFGRLTPHFTGKLRMTRTPHSSSKALKESTRAVKQIDDKVRLTLIEYKRYMQDCDGEISAPS